MNPAHTVDVFLACVDWARNCPGAADLARSAAELAVARAETALGLAWQPPVELGIVLGDDASQRRLNRGYRRRDAPTNVLAFPAWEPGTPLPPGAPLLLGDIVLALETVTREAAEQEKSVADHLRHLTVHGVLHLFGYDHITEAEAALMESLERSILTELGVPDPYRDTISSIERAAVQR
jgi:probable rRNA maturation factor